MTSLPGPERNFVARLLLEPLALPAESTAEDLLLDVLAKLRKEYNILRMRTLEQEIKSGLLSPQLLEKSKELLDLKRARP